VPQTIVIGAGVFGAWTALRLAQAGHAVTLVDAYGPANGRASSSDHSRVIRAGYGRDRVYSEWVANALDDWRSLERDTGERLLTRTGALFLGPGGHEYIRDTYDTLTAIGRRAEWLDTAALRDRFPQIAADDLGPAVFEADAGVLRARQAVHTAVRLAVSRYGVSLVTARVQPLDEQRPAAELRLADGRTILPPADHIVCACGPWLPQLLPSAIGGRIRVTRQEVLYFGVPSGDGRFDASAFPVWIDFAAGLYGLPDLDAMGFKVGIDRHGDAIDPDTADRVVSLAVVEQTRSWLQRRFPALGGAPLVDAHVCQYENSSSGDFIIDRHPAWPNVWIVGSGSGHGFKHGPAIARHLLSRINGAPADARFALAGKTGRAARTVY
jgi:glycine/D-amino acid oxidase-like deaminating enzyme